MLRLISLTLLSSFILTQATAQVYSFNETCQLAHQQILKLKLSSASELLDKERKHNPKNLVPVYLSNYIDFISILISEDKKLFQELEDLKSTRIDKLETGDKESPFYLYFLAETHLQWAFARLKFEEYFTAAWEIRKAYILLSKNVKKFPDFKPSRKSLGLLHALIGTIPQNYVWIASLAGIEGSISQGRDELSQVIEDSSSELQIFRQEALILYTFLILYLENREEDAWQIISSHEIKLEDNLLNHFVAASIAMKTGHNDQAIQILSNRPKGKEYFPFHFMDYMLGLAKMHRLDPNASRYLQAFVENFKGLNYIKDSYQKLGWQALLAGKHDVYEEMMEHCRKHGYTITDADKQAMRETSEADPPNPLLLKARLLFDGGYYERAIRVFSGRSSKQFDKFRDQLEFTYRAGRIYHKLGQIEKAIRFYEATIRSGSKAGFYFAANAALQLGSISEEAGNLEKAANYYRQTLSMKNHPYKNSLDQKAKTGLKRIKAMSN